MSKQLKHISDATYLEESTNIRLILKGIIAITILIIALVIWAGFIQISESTQSFGQLVPEGEIPLIQHLEGGIVEKVYVKEGEKVKAGQLLILLKTNELNSELEQLRSQEVMYLLEAERLTTFLNDKPPNPEAWAQKVINSQYNSVNQEAQIADLIKEQVELLQSEYVQATDKKAGLSNLLAQKQEQLKEYVQKKEIWVQHMKLLNKEFEMYSKLKSTNYISGKDYLEILRSVNQAKGTGAELDSQAEQAREAIKEAQNKIKEVDSTAREESLTALAKSKSALMEIYYKIKRAIAQIKRSHMKSPIDGTVKGLVATPGYVAKPGFELLEIVPNNELLVGETKIQPREVGYLKVGNQVKVKILTFDYSRFGSIEGKLINISATTFVDSEGATYYKGKVGLDAQEIMVNGQAKPLKAGMTIQCDIITGSKTLLDYLLKPIHRAISESFHER